MTETSGVRDEAPPKPKLLDYLSGIALGLLVSGLVGLSTSQLAGEVLAGLVALLATFFGLGGKLPLQSTLSSARLLAFCIGFIVGLPLGIATRTHALLAPSFGETVKTYEAASVDPSLAIELAIFNKTGLRTGSLSLVPEPSERPTETLPIAFSAVTGAQCSALLDSAHASPQLRLQAMANFPAPWERPGTLGLSFNKSDQGKFADFVHDTFCNESK